MKNLIKLLVDNQKSGAASVRFDGAAGAANVYLKGPISADYGASAAALRAAFAEAGGADVTLNVNSPGGDVFEAREMQAVITGYAGKVSALIAGVAASAATFVTMACDDVAMLKGSRYMIHNGWSICMGDKLAMAAMGGLLEQFDGELAAEYAAKTGATVAQVVAWMNAETWFTADQALEAKFVDRLVENTRNEKLGGMWNLSAYANAPAREADPAPPALDYVAIHAANRQRMRLLEIA